MTAAAICLCDVLRMEMVDTLQTSGQSQKYFPAQLVLITVGELFRSVCPFSPGSRRARAAGLQGPASAGASRTAGERGSHSTTAGLQVNMSRPPPTGQPLSEMKTDLVISLAFTLKNLLPVVSP